MSLLAVSLVLHSKSSSLPSGYHSASSLTSATVFVNCPSLSNRAALKYWAKILDMYWSLLPGQTPSKNAIWPPRAVTTIATWEDFSAALIGIAVKIKGSSEDQYRVALRLIAVTLSNGLAIFKGTYHPMAETDHRPLKGKESGLWSCGVCYATSRACNSLWRHRNRNESMWSDYQTLLLSLTGAPSPSSIHIRLWKECRTSWRCYRARLPSDYSASSWDTALQLTQRLVRKTHKLPAESLESLLNSPFSTSQGTEMILAAVKIDFASSACSDK